MFVEHELVVAGPKVHSAPSPVTSSRKSVEGCKNKARTNKTSRHPPVLFLNQVPNVGESAVPGLEPQALEARVRFLPLGTLQIRCFSASV